MARTSNITFGQVAQIADAMKAAGTRPTARAVRERIGSGSMGTIHNLLKQWQGKGPSEDDEDKPDLPQHVTEAIMDFVQTMTAERIEDMADQLRDAQEAADDLARENERYSEDLENTENIAVGIRAELARLQGINEQLRSQIEKANQMIQEEKEKSAIAENLAYGVRQEAAVASAMVQSLEQQLQDAKQSAQDWRGQAETLNKQITQRERENAALQSALNQASRQLEEQCKQPTTKPAASRKAPAKNTEQMQLIDSPKPAPSSPRKAKTSAKKEKPSSDAGSTATVTS